MSSQIDEMNAGRLPKSTEILERAKQALISPIVTGPLRTPKNIPFIKEARGAHVFDVDGHDYVDITMAYGPLILGHCHPVVVEAIERASRLGTVYAMAHEHEVKLAELMVDAIPCADRVAFSSSGTEATLHAMRIARARTGKDKIAKFEGGYHGVHDYALVSGSLAQPAGSPEDPQSVPDTPGIPDGTVEQVVTLSYGNPASLDKIRAMADDLAAVFIEPVPSSYPIDLSDYLAELRRVTRECGVLLVFDEVISGFRLGYGGAQTHFGVTPDIATYGKVMGGGALADRNLQRQSDDQLCRRSHSRVSPRSSGGLYAHRYPRCPNQERGSRVLSRRGVQSTADRPGILVPPTLHRERTQELPRPPRQRGLSPGQRTR